MAKAIIEATTYIHNPANKKTVAQILAKHLRLNKADLIERTYQELLMEVPRKPCPRYEGAASALKLMAQYGLNPKAAQLRPEDVIDTDCARNSTPAVLSTRSSGISETISCGTSQSLAYQQ
jgi:hypothetical protein